MSTQYAEPQLQLRVLPEGYAPPPPPWRPGVKLRLLSVALAFLVGALLPFFPFVGAVLLVALLVLVRVLWRSWAPGIRLPSGRVIKVGNWKHRSLNYEPVDANSLAAIFELELVMYGPSGVLDEAPAVVQRDSEPDGDEHPDEQPW